MTHIDGFGMEVKAFTEVFMNTQKHQGKIVGLES